MSALIRRSLVGAALACFCVTATAVDYGRTTGAFDVSSSGGANYTIPVLRTT